MLVRTLVILFVIAGLALGGWYAWTQLWGQEEKSAGVPEKAAAPEVAAEDPLAAPMREGLADVRAGNYSGALQRLLPLLRQGHASRRFEELKSIVGELNVEEFFSNAPSAEKMVHTVQRGDTISAISKKYNVPGELIVRINKMDGVNLQIGQELSIPQAVFSAVISTGANTLTLFNGTKFFKEYPIKKLKIPKGLAAGDKMGLREKIAWRAGERIPFGSNGYVGSARWIVLDRGGFTLYGMDENEQEVPPPGVGAGLAPPDISELFLLVSTESVFQFAE